MITKPTVLVLGAGASSPYGYPTGKALKKEIIEALSHQNTIAYQLLQFRGNNNIEIGKFRLALATSSSGSIDAFLEHRPEFIDMGKLAITAILAQKEDTETLFNIGDWYEHLFQKLNRDFNSFGSNCLSIITFNYDRSLEHFIFTALKSSYNQIDEDTSTVLSAIKIIHLHGQIGNLPWQGKFPLRPYGEKENHTMLWQSSDQIKIIHEREVEQSEPFNKAKQLLFNAEHIYFLGFGYHSENTRRLGITELDIINKKVFGTAFHMTNREVDDITVRCNNKIDLRQQYSQTHPVLQFMRENISFI